jgi:hypothetical protein
MHVCLLAYFKIPPQGLLALKPFWKNEGWWSSNYFLLTGDDTGVIRARSLVLCQEERKESQHLYKCNVESEVDYWFHETIIYQEQEGNCVQKEKRICWWLLMSSLDQDIL